MKVLFISPHYPEEMQEFTRGLSEVGARVYGVGDVPLQQIPSHVRRYLSGYIQTASLFAEDRAVADIAPAVRHLRLDRVECLWEPCIELAAKLREQLGLPGMRYVDAVAFRDKAIMKERLVAAGLRVPHFARASTASMVWEAAERIGYPLIIKPIAGAGSKDTYRVEDPKGLQAVLDLVKHVPEVSVEEYIDGEEFTYDTVCINGVPAFDSVAQYIPKPIEARSKEWISPAQIVLRDPHIPQLEPGVTLGKNVLVAMGVQTGFTHMEWYLKPNGEAVFGEIGGRAPGGKLVDQMNFANDFDVYREWARSVCWQTFNADYKRRYHCGAVFKRAIGQGRICAIEGLDEIRRQCGPWLVGLNLLPIGSPRRDWRNTLISDGWLFVRHPDYATCKKLVDLAVSDLRIFAR